VPETGAGQVALRVSLEKQRRQGGAAAWRLEADCGACDDAGWEGKPGSGFTIPARGELTLSAEGPHILISGLKKALTAYDDFELTWRFATAGSLKVEVMVGPAAGG
jgi:hypothetical protein